MGFSSHKKQIYQNGIVRIRAVVVRFGTQEMGLTNLSWTVLQKMRDPHCLNILSRLRSGEGGTLTFSFMILTGMPRKFIVGFVNSVHQILVVRLYF